MDNHFQNIFEQLADFRGISGYDGWMIGACVYEQVQIAEQDDGVPREKSKKTIDDICTSEIAKSSANFAVMRNRLEADGIRYRLELHVVKPEEQSYERDNIEIGASTECINEIGHLTDNPVKNEAVFSKTDILRFVDAVGDENSIHRMVHAVVPGLLMVEWMLGNLPETGNLTASPEEKKLKCRFRFEKPVFVDEKLQVEVRTERGKQIYECKREDKEIVWNMRIL